MLSAATLLALALPAYGAVHESLAALPYGWTESSTTVAGNSAIKLQVALQYQNLDQLETKLASVSTPGSPDYGKYLDMEEVNALFGASNDSANAVMDWLRSSGATQVINAGNTITFTTTVDNANQMLDTEFKVYTNGQTSHLRTMGYSIPDDLVGDIDFVSPTTYFSTMQRHGVIPSKTEREVPTKRQFQTSCETQITINITDTEQQTFDVIGPECLKELYNVGNYSADPSSGSSIAFGSFLNQSASYSDLEQFEQIFNVPSQNFTILALINGGINNQTPSLENMGEANLDVQNIVGLADGLAVGEYITGGMPPFTPDLLSPNASSNQNEPYLEYYTYLLSQPNSDLPNVISNSYGDHENTVPEAYAQRVCNMIGMMGMRGITILESSGDEGTGAVCRSNEPPYEAQFTPIFPATCPYLTAVGGTQFFNPEWAWNASSGGFSNYFSTAWYQKDAVDAYLNQYIDQSVKATYTANNYTNFTGRGFPDVSAHSLYPDYLTVIAGGPQPNGGTSAASPVVAAIFGLINDARLRAGQPAIGFANPWLYNISSQGLNDITEGGSLGCNGVDLQNGIVIPDGGVIPFASWNATVGWDPVTGLGTPDFQKLKELALAAGSYNSTRSRF